MSGLKNSYLLQGLKLNLLAYRLKSYNFLFKSHKVIIFTYFNNFLFKGLRTVILSYISLEAFKIIVS